MARSERTRCSTVQFTEAVRLKDFMLFVGGADQVGGGKADDQPGFADNAAGPEPGPGNGVLATLSNSASNLCTSLVRLVCHHAL